MNECLTYEDQAVEPEPMQFVLSEGSLAVAQMVEESVMPQDAHICPMTTNTCKLNCGPRDCKLAG